MTSFACTSRQARTHRLHWMQASRFTAIAVCDRSGVGTPLVPAGPRDGKRLVSHVHRIGPAPELRLRIARLCLLRLVRHQHLDDHLARRLRALVVGGHLHARRGLADAGRRQHALALDLHHAGPAIAVGPIAGIGLPTEMGYLVPQPVRHLPDRLARLRRHLPAVEHELDGLTHGHPSPTNSLYFMPFFSIVTPLRLHFSIVLPAPQDVRLVISLSPT